MTKMHNPPHPGLTLRDDVLPGARAFRDRCRATIECCPRDPFARAQWSRRDLTRNGIAHRSVAGHRAWRGSATVAGRAMCL